MTTVGLLYPGHSAEDDYGHAEKAVPDLSLPLVHTSVGTDAHRIDDLLDLGGDVRLTEGVITLCASTSPDSVMWACTSGSFVFGWDGARRQVEAVASAAGVPASSTSFAFVNAARALGVRRVAVAASYPRDVADRFVEFLATGGVAVSSLGAHDVLTAAEVGTFGEERVLEMVAATDRADAEAVLVPDTAMHTLDRLADLEAVAGMPVLTANQVTVWEGLRLLGPVPEVPRLGTLFRQERTTP